MVTENDTDYVDTDTLLGALPIDRDEVKEITKRSTLNGTFVTVPPVKYSILPDPDSDRHAIVKMDAQVEGADGEKGRTFFSLRSRLVEGRDGKPAMASQLYVRADKAFQRSYGSQAATLGDLTKFVNEYPITLRINNGFVVDIRPVVA